MHKVHTSVQALEPVVHPLALRNLLNEAGATVRDIISSAIHTTANINLPPELTEDVFLARLEAALARFESTPAYREHHQYGLRLSKIGDDFSILGGQRLEL